MDTHSVRARLLAETEAGFPNLKGTRMAGVIPVSQAAVDELLSPVASGKLTIRCEDGDRIVGRYAGVRFPAATIVGVDSSLTITLRFPGWARPALWIARKRNIPYVRFTGSYIHIDLGAIPSIAAYRYLWKYLSIGLSAQTGMLIVRFGVHIT